MLQLNTKPLLQGQLVKSDPKLPDLVTRLDKNISNLGALSAKAFKLLTKMTQQENQALVQTYDSLAMMADKLMQCQ